MDKDFLDISYEKYAETGDGSAYEDQSDESDGKTITLELYDRNIKKRTQAYPDDAFVTYIIVNVTDESKHTMRWLRNNL